MKATSLTWTTALIAALAIAPAANAQQGPPRGGPRGHHPSPLLIALDTDKDHKISAEEIAAAPTVLAKLDADGDGAVTKEELRPKPPEGAPEGREGGAPPRPEGEKKEGRGPRGERGERKGPPADPLLTALDTDKDGTLSAAEITAAATSLATLDTDKDGVVSEKEFRPAPPEGAPEGETEEK